MPGKIAGNFNFQLFKNFNVLICPNYLHCGLAKPSFDAIESIQRTVGIQQEIKLFEQLKFMLVSVRLLFKRTLLA